jgi:hypothetical protein
MFMKTPILLLALALLCAGALASPLAGGNGQVNAIGGSDQITTESRSLTVPCYVLGVKGSKKAHRALAVG